MNQQLIGEIQEARFTPTRLREGYDMSQVDYLLDQVCAKLSAAEPVDDLIASARFTPVKLREGYDMDEVDDLLARVRSGAASGAEPAAEPMVAAGRDSVGDSASDSAIERVEGGVAGFLRRLFRSRQP